MFVLVVMVTKLVQISCSSDKVDDVVYICCGFGVAHPKLVNSRDTKIVIISIRKISGKGGDYDD